MLTKIARKRFLEKYPEFVTADYRRDKFFSPDGVAYYILYVEARSTVGLCSKMAAELTNLCTSMGYSGLNFMGEITAAWRYRNHDYPPVKKALAYLVANNISKSFNGAIYVPLAHLPVFLRHLFWLVRCNGVVFLPHFSDPGFNIIGSLCKYGNLHLTIINKTAELSFDEVMEHNDLFYLREERCGGGRIPGRKGTYTAGN
ncbi:hypothetical protein [Mucilaginibacter sp.]|uniref:hypothetical protein n=1 Tax=Mucilaginibacter sp. TaxID=1882438 RepID=UPI003262D517